MDRFLIADNPMSDNGQVAVIHTVDPIAIIEILEGHVTPATPHRHYSYGPEPYTFRVHHLFTTEFDGEQHHIIVDKLLNRAWHWYMAYMEWEDKNIDGTI